MPPMSSCPWEEVDDEEMKRSIKRSFILSFIGFLRRAALHSGWRTDSSCRLWSKISEYLNQSAFVLLRYQSHLTKSAKKPANFVQRMQLTSLQHSSNSIRGRHAEGEKSARPRGREKASDTFIHPTCTAAAAGGD